MRLARQLTTAVWAATLLLRIASGQSIGNEVAIGPIPVPQNINGISVTLPVTAFVQITTVSSALQLRARVQIGLADLQTKVGEIVDTFAFPTNNCASFSGNNPVVRVWGKQLSVSGAALNLRLNGDAELWDCRENPVLNSKVEWKNDGVFGTPSPRVVTWPGDPIKNRLVNQPVTANVPATLKVSNDQTIAVELAPPTVDLGGQFGGVTDGVLRLAGVDVSARASEALRQGVSTSVLRQGIPPEFAKLNPRILGATFKDLAGKPVAEIQLAAAVPAADAGELLQLLSTARK